MTKWLGPAEISPLDAVTVMSSGLPITLSNVTTQEQPSSPTPVSDPDTYTSYSGGSFMSSCTITTEVSSHEAPLAKMLDVL